MLARNSTLTHVKDGVQANMYNARRRALATFVLQVGKTLGLCAPVFVTYISVLRCVVFVWVHYRKYQHGKPAMSLSLTSSSPTSPLAHRLDISTAPSIAFMINTMS